MEGGGGLTSTTSREILDRLPLQAILRFACEMTSHIQFLAARTCAGSTRDNALCLVLAAAWSVPSGAWLSSLPARMLPMIPSLLRRFLQRCAGL